jgi:hypothetical protein
VNSFIWVHAKKISKYGAHFRFVSATKKPVISLKLQSEEVVEVQRMPVLSVER